MIAHIAQAAVGGVHGLEGVMNILLTTLCNRRCPYCFAQERITFGKDRGSDKVPKYISKESFTTALEFARRSRLRQVGILGGEPSIHPEFLSMLFRAWSSGVHTKVFTNGLWRSEDVHELAQTPSSLLRNMNLVLNINEPSRTPKRQQEKQHLLLDNLGRHCSLSFNISRVGFDPLFLVDVVNRFRTARNIRLGLAQPLAQLTNECVEVEDYHRLAGTIVELSRLCDENNIRLGFDCGFTLCMFTAEELGTLLQSGTRFRATCGPALDVGTDLSVWACFPLSPLTQGMLLTEFTSVGELHRRFRRDFAQLYRAGTLDECIGCRRRRRGQCSGGCAAHVYRRLAT